MSDFYSFGNSSQPRRVISIEPTFKGGSCRSCSISLKPGELRVKVAYPNILVHYYTKSGTPSFFMHPFCYQANPVDFLHVGPGAYKDTLPIKGFAVNPSESIIGYEKYPDQHEYFRHSFAMYLKEQEQAASMLDEPSSALLQEFTASAKELQELNFTTSAKEKLPKQSMAAESKVVNNAIPILDSTTATAALPPPGTSGSNRKRPSSLLSYQIPMTMEADAEENRIEWRQFHKKWEGPNFAETIQTMTLKPKDATIDKCLHCHCHSIKPERQWASPTEAEKILGISSAILRKLANAREIPVFKRLSGHRVYNIPAIRDYIAKHIIQPKSLQKNPTREIDVGQVLLPSPCAVENASIEETTFITDSETGRSDKFFECNLG